ncbi:hypothetical protein, partial [Stutzerimonas degradans]|uniref:hypothetical protein n=1 Tax=Stutzerimonas degradans TaxID=2968968 RepID=UPI001A98E8DD
APGMPPWQRSPPHLVVDANDAAARGLRGVAPIWMQQIATEPQEKTAHLSPLPGCEIDHEQGCRVASKIFSKLKKSSTKCPQNQPESPISHPRKAP